MIAPAPFLRCCVWVWVTLQLLPSRPARAHAGQSLTEAALVIAVIGIVCIPAMSLLREAMAAAYVTHQQGLAAAAPTPSPIP